MRISYSDCDVPGVAYLMRRSADKLAAVGANFLIFSDDTIHQALPLTAILSFLSLISAKNALQSTPKTPDNL